MTDKQKLTIRQPSIRQMDNCLSKKWTTAYQTSDKGLPASNKCLSDISQMSQTNVYQATDLACSHHIFFFFFIHHHHHPCHCPPLLVAITVYCCFALLFLLSLLLFLFWLLLCSEFLIDICQMSDGNDFHSDLN